MILAGNQPYFLPYIGYWQLINAADVFKVSDDYLYINKGWVNRNRILINGQSSYFHLEVRHASSNRKINELEIVEIPVEKKLKQVEMAYSRAPFFSAGMALMETIYAYPERNLAGFLFHSMTVIRDYLGIQTPFVKTSDFPHNDDYKREYRIFDLCERLGADTYINAIGGQALYSYEDFRNHGIRLAFLKTGDIRYRQFKNEFVPNLSILDVIMFNSVEDIRKMLTCYTLLWENERVPLSGGMPQQG